MFGAALCVLQAQVLARPGWAGSGVAPEPWWRRAVFYRIDPVRFQDSDGDGKGDLPGITGRMDYLQSLGIDALLLEPTPGGAALDDLIREASRHHLRVLLSVDPATESGPRTALVSLVRSWMGAGAAGVFLPKPAADAAGYDDLILLLRSVVVGFPGERVLLAEASSLPLSPTRPVRPGRRAETSPVRGGLLGAGPPLPAMDGSVVAMRQAMAERSDAAADPLLRFAADPATGSPDAAALAAVLLASRGAVIFSAGDEIGLDLPAPGSPAVMQWTPSNRTSAPVERPASIPAVATEFGAYHPYVPPPPGSLTGMSPTAPRATVDGNIPAALPDPDTLPGFTSGVPPPVAAGEAARNVITEDRDPRSLLNAYRTLIGLHHGNATLRNGTQTGINRDAEGALVWVRRAPVGSRTAGNLLVAANLSGKPLVLTLDSDIEAVGMRGGALRPLFVSSTEPLTGQTTAHLTLPPHAVYLGEIFHAGALRTKAVSERPRRSRHRVRR